MEYQEAKDKFIQAWGSLGSSWGVNRTMAQIHALLLVSTHALSAEEVMGELKISRGNANMNLRTLMEWGLVEKELVPGERKEFFKAGKDVWIMAQQVARERKKRELEPMLKVLGQLKNMEGSGQEVDEFKQVTGDIESFAGQAEATLDKFIHAKNNWLTKLLARLA